MKTLVGIIDFILVWGVIGLLVRSLYFYFKGKDWRKAAKQFGIGAVVTIVFMGISGPLVFRMTPEEEAEHKKFVQEMKEKREKEDKEKAEKKALEEKQKKDKAEADKKMAEARAKEKAEKEQRDKEEKQAKEQAERERKAQEKQEARKAKFEKERYEGWNKADEYAAGDNVSKALELIRDYRDIIQSSDVDRIPPSHVERTPWEHYGKIVYLTGGQITQLEQAPPEQSVAKAFGGKYSYGTMKCGATQVFFHVLNTRAQIEKGEPTFRGFYVGKGQGTNLFGANVGALTFVGFVDRPKPQQ